MDKTAIPRLFDRADGRYIVPIRHHSPACAWHLRALIADVKPAAILIEGPCDFDALIPAVTDPATVPPVAVAALGKIVDGGRSVSYFPFSSHGPEYVALVAAKAAGIPARFIDLPSQDPAMTSADDHDVARLMDERMFDSSDYVRALVTELGCRDGNEVWDHLFETRIAAGGWDAFFGDVGLYCAHLRDCTPPERMAADGTLARESHMRACLAQARAEHAGPIVAVVGGFHAPVLLEDDALLEADAAPAGIASPASGEAHLIRYGDRQLNALSGYAAGLPLPGFYDRLWQAAADGGPDPFGRLATSLITGFAAHLRTALPAFAPPVPVVGAALEHARRLAALRGRPGPLRDDIVDACRSTLLGGEDSGGAAHPVIAELLAWLTGARIGDVPASAGSPPLIEAARAQARSLGFTVTDGERRNRDLDIYRNPKHRRASRFLHAMAWLDTDFARRMAGPDLRAGVDLDRLHESWSVAWSPLVEARLIEHSGVADSIGGAVAANIARRIDALGDDGKGHDAVAVVALFTVACQAGVGDDLAQLLPSISREIADDPSLANIAEALRDLIGLWRNRALLGFEHPEGLEALMVAAWRRALHLVPALAETREDGVREALGALTTLREAVELADGGIDGGLFDEAVAALVERAGHPAISGAVHALACLSGRLAPQALGARVAGGLAGGYSEAGDKVAFLRGVLAISHELLWGAPAVVDAIEESMDRLDGDAFLALLPHLRLAFGQLDPRGIDRLARMIADRRGGDAGALTAPNAVSAAEMPALLAVDAAVARELALAGWA